MPELGPDGSPRPVSPHALSGIVGYVRMRPGGQLIPITREQLEDAFPFMSSPRTATLDRFRAGLIGVDRARAEVGLPPYPEGGSASPAR